MYTYLELYNINRFSLLLLGTSTLGWAPLLCLETTIFVLMFGIVTAL